MNKKFTKDIVVMYHAGCSDGFTAAWTAWKKFGDKADYFPAHYQEPAPKGLTGKRVYILDFAAKIPVIKEIMKQNKVTSIDHHATGEEAAKMTEGYVFDQNHSGAVLARKYFHPGKKIPKICEYIEDRDLWRFKLVNTREICAFIDTFNLSFKEWDRLAKIIDDSSMHRDIVEKGHLVLSYEKRIMEDIIGDTARPVTFEGYKIYAVNAPHWYASGIGAILNKKFPPMAITWSCDKDAIVVSLRSDGSVDVGQIAKKYGGGGHPKAAGFELPLDSPLPWKSRK